MSHCLKRSRMLFFKLLSRKYRGLRLFLTFLTLSLFLILVRVSIIFLTQFSRWKSMNPFSFLD
jgi:hypothetical protein